MAASHDRAARIARLLGTESDLPPLEETPQSFPDLVTASELADFLGLSLARVYAFGRDGRFPRESRQQFRFRAAVRAYADYCRDLARAKETDAALAAQKLRVATESAEKLALQNQKSRGDLIATADVERAWVSVMTDLRAAVLAIPSRVASRAALDRVATAALDAEIRAALEGIAHDH